MHITIDGFSGGITPPNNDDAVSFALTLLLEGYGVRVNGLRVNVEYGPGYDAVVWSEGDYAGERLDTVQVFGKSISRMEARQMGAIDPATGKVY